MLNPYAITMTATLVVLAGFTLYLAVKVDRLRGQCDAGLEREAKYRAQLDETDRLRNEAVRNGALVKHLQISAEMLQMIAEKGSQAKDRHAAKVYLEAICSAKKWVQTERPPAPDSDRPGVRPSGRALGA